MQAINTKPAIRYSRGYSIIIMQLNGVASNGDEEWEEVRRFNEGELSKARFLFDHHAQQLEWSLRHRTNMGISKLARVAVHLFDRGERFDIAEKEVYCTH